MSGVYRYSHRMIVRRLWDFFGVRMSLGTVNRVRKEASEALAERVEEAKSYIQSANFARELILNFLTETIFAHRAGKATPSLIPTQDCCLQYHPQEDSTPFIA